MCEYENEGVKIKMNSKVFYNVLHKSTISIKGAQRYFKVNTMKNKNTIVFKIVSENCTSRGKIDTTNTHTKDYSLS